MASRSPRLIFVGLLSALSLGGCAYDDGYGYGGVSVGTGYAGDYYPGGYYNPGYYGGWYNDYYYPGTGYYVFDRGGRRHRWDDRQRSYWEVRRQQYRARDQARRPDFDRGRNDWRRRDGDNGRTYGRRDGQADRSFEGRRAWRQNGQAQVEGQAAVRPRPERPSFRDNNRVDRGVTRAERPTFTPRQDRGRGGFRGRQRPQ
ncbi:hypothetical protein [Sphingobium sp. SCG-1]|uniref:hypothetical protein n=1 Tax=Sphingobium sp. SCG-1 TaxID=2072936 RepID=UPI001CB967BB|nr:hypothetical protein [Sphingobium sp. SCG-1]